MIIFHIGMLFAIMRFLFNIILPRMHEEYLPNKILLLPFAFVLYWLVEKYYESKSNAICEKYDRKYAKNKHVLYTVKNIFFVVALYIVPLLIGISFINMSV